MAIDKYYCINLYERDDRMYEAKTVFDKYNIPVNFFRVNKDKEDGRRGCFTSHVKIINDAYDKKLNNILIFEDDIVCYLSKEEFDQKMQQIHEFMDNNDFDILFIGSIPDIFNKRVVKVYKDIYKANAYCTHAYILSRKGIEKFRNLTYNGTPIDFVYMDSDNAYAMYPSIFYQNESKSDIAPSWHTFFGFKSDTVKLRESYATNVNIPLNWLIKSVVILSLIAFFLTSKIIFIIVPILFLVYHIVLR
ncbi:hypothetical protein QJ856_gp0803 [Tupanvirus deep ocean]|uniref:Uncharacterized protein n=2 Tax=Tupanvirus TaxID=2094720 RepID=A0AC62A849_9VIRU|nr:hypothetical protein QJ856_gp0803 [Tupanvirus deep ocean]QKU33950.1 hypothetical protein [Tupanvirus deep ocean]